MKNFTRDCRHCGRSIHSGAILIASKTGVNGIVRGADYYHRECFIRMAGFEFLPEHISTKTKDKK